jgi:hypothetical protein
MQDLLWYGKIYSGDQAIITVFTKVANLHYPEPVISTSHLCNL